MSPRTIGFDATAAWTQGGGIGRYTRELLTALLDENDALHFKIFAAKAESPLPVVMPQFSRPGVSFREVPFTAKWLYRLWYRLRLPLPTQLFTGNIDLFHSPDFVLPPVAGAIPTLLTVHDLSFAYFPETFTVALVDYLNRVVPWSVRRASHILADSVSTKRDLMSLYQTPEEKITVLYSGVNEIFQPVHDKDRLRQVCSKYGIGDEPFILTVGTLQPRKNVQMLVRAFASHTVPGSSHRLIIAGAKGWLYEQLLEYVRRMGLDRRVRFVGFVDDDDLPALYSAANLFAFPSLYEGFGLPILEAMACGTPVISSDASSLPEVTGDAGLLVAPQDEAAWAQSLAQLIGDEALRERLRAKGFEQAKRFSWRASARQLLGIYERLLAIH